jgi:hypothetical protein
MKQESFCSSGGETNQSRKSSARIPCDKYVTTLPGLHLKLRVIIDVSVAAVCSFWRKSCFLLLQLSALAAATVPAGRSD